MRDMKSAWVSFVIVAGIAAMLAGCQAQRADTNEAAVAPAEGGAVDDIAQPGTYRSGLWEYALVVTAPGTRSEGTVGELSYSGKPVPQGLPGDYYQTPWGDVLWVENDMLWGEHGWILRPAGSSGGRQLPEPWLMAGGPVVMALVLVESDQAPAENAVPAWVSEAMAQLGVERYQPEGPWFPLCDQAITIHDTKMLGTLTVRLSPAESSDLLTIQLGGTDFSQVELPREDGATALVSRTLGIVQNQTFYLAFRVDKAAPTWPAPLVVGLDANGQTLVVDGVREVVIRLPGDRSSGLEWTVTKVQGEGLTTSSVTLAGSPQFTPDPGEQAIPKDSGTYENAFRVAETGITDVELTYRRPWETDQPAEDTFRVTLDVRSVPGVSAAPDQP